MHLLDRHGSLIAATSGAFVAVLSSLLSLGYDSAYAEQSGEWFAQFVTPQWSGSVTVVIAVLALLGLQARRSAATVAVAGVVGPAVIALPSFVPVAAHLAVSVTAVGSGLLLAACAALASGHRRAQAGLLVGVLGAVVFGQAVRTYLPYDDGRWMLSVGPNYVDAVIHPLVLVIPAALVAFVAFRTVPSVGEWRAQDVVVLLALPFAYLLVYVYVGSSVSTTTMWILAVVLAFGFTLVATRLLDRRDGNAVLVGFAIAATTVSGLAWSTRSWWVAAVGVLVLVIGVLLGYRWPRPRLGVCILAVVTATGILTGTAWFDAVPTVAYAVLFPAAVGFCIGSCVPVGIGGSVLAPTIPLSMTLFSVSAPQLPPSFYWTDGTDGSRSPVVATVSPLFVAVVVATVAVILAGVALSPRARR
nr:hypothetical protein [Rhodococcus sp. (in: high G+C Gram-positive bacteria)]